MKLLELTRSFSPSVGGLENFVSNRLKIYKQLKIDYELISTNFQSEKIAHNLNLQEVTFLKQYSPYNITPSLSKYLKKNYDVLSINLIGRYYADFAILYASFKKNVKIILTPHFIFHTDRYLFIKKMYIKFVLPYLLKRVDKIICFTNNESEYWQKEFNIDKNKLTIIPHYFEIVEPEKKSGDGNYLLYLGRFEKNKKVDLLLKAFKRIENKNLRLFITIAEEDLPVELAALTKNDKRIKLIGYVAENEKNKLLAKASAIIYPSDFEAFGAVLLEASSFSKPLLVSNIGVFKEILDPKGAIFFDNNVESLANCINEFLKLSELERREMGIINFNNLNRYSFSEILNRYKTLFESLQ